MIDLVMGGGWARWASAACLGADPDLFFSPDGVRGAARSAREDKAKAFCAGCPVVESCLAAAVEDDVRYGVWGGLTEREREVLRARVSARRNERGAA